MAIARKAAKMESLWLCCLSAAPFLELPLITISHLLGDHRRQAVGRVTLSMLCLAAVLVLSLGCPYPSASVLKWKSWQRARASIKQASQYPAPLQFLHRFPLLLSHLPFLCTTVARIPWDWLCQKRRKRKVVDKAALKQMTRWLRLSQSLSNLSIVRVPNVPLSFRAGFSVMFCKETWTLLFGLILICMKRLSKWSFDSKGSTQEAEKVHDVQTWSYHG